jgi:hypothetical protein
MRVITGDCRDVMAGLDPETFHAVVSDPPYGLSFMDHDWDHEVPGPDYWRHALRVTKPGGHLAAFGGTRTWHRLACAIEDAGWEIRDTMLWLYGQGMPKTGDASKALDRRQSEQRRIDVLAVTKRIREARDAAGVSNAEIDALFGKNGMAGHWTSQASQPAIPTMDQWTAIRELLKLDDRDLDIELVRLNASKGEPGPAWAMREIIGHVDMVVLDDFVGREHERRMVAITASATEEARAWEGWSTTLKPGWEPIILARKPMVGNLATNLLAHGCGVLNVRGCSIPKDGDDGPRWPANVLFDEAAAADLDASASELGPGGYPPGGPRPSRYFYTPKARNEERDLGGVINKHKTVKPVALMRWVVRLVSPPNAVILDPFAGSGSTLVAARLEGIDAIGAELDPVNAEVARRRVELCGFAIDDEGDDRAVKVDEPAQRSLW